MDVVIPVGNWSGDVHVANNTSYWNGGVHTAIKKCHAPKKSDGPDDMADRRGQK